MSRAHRFLSFLGLCLVVVLALHLPAGYTAGGEPSVSISKQVATDQPFLLSPPAPSPRWSGAHYTRQLTGSLERIAQGRLWVSDSNGLHQGLPVLAFAWLRSFGLFCFALGTGAAAGFLLGGVAWRFRLRPAGAVTAAAWLVLSGAWYATMGPGGPAWVLPGLVLAAAPLGSAAHLMAEALQTGKIAAVRDGLPLLFKLTFFAALPMEWLSRYDGLVRWMAYPDDPAVAAAAGLIYCVWAALLLPWVEQRARVDVVLPRQQLYPV